MPRAHLIIQGPMLSHFSKDFPWMTGPDQVTQEHKQVYDCAPLVSRICEEYANTFSTIVLSTWDSAPLPKNAKNLMVVQTPAAEVTHLANPFKQIVGVLKGYEALKSNLQGPDDIIVKTRTDLWIDLAKLLTHVVGVEQEYRGWEKVGQRGFIHALDSAGPFFFNDLVVAARAQDFFKFWNASGRGSSTITRSHIHEALGTDYAWRYREQLQIPRQWFLDYYKWKAPWHRSLTHLNNGKIWDYLLCHCFCWAPHEITSSIVWRGVAWDDIPAKHRLSKSFSFDQWGLVQKHHNKAVSRLTDRNHWEIQRSIKLRQLPAACFRALRILMLVKGHDRLVQKMDDLLDRV